jgi:hypothetical protein
VLALILLLLAGPAAAGPIFTAELLGSNEVPPNASTASGNITLEFDDDLMGVGYAIEMAGITTPLLQAHIHTGPPDANGPVVAFLFEFCAITPSGCDAENNQIFGDDIRLQGRAILTSGDFEGLLAEMQSGNTYVNVHTEAFNGGELRGQLVPEPNTALLLAAGLAGLAVRGRRLA